MTDKWVGSLLTVPIVYSTEEVLRLILRQADFLQKHKERETLVIGKAVSLLKLCQQNAWKSPVADFSL